MEAGEGDKDIDYILAGSFASEVNDKERKALEKAVSTGGKGAGGNEYRPPSIGPSDGSDKFSDDATLDSKVHFAPDTHPPSKNGFRSRDIALIRFQ